MIEQLKLSPKSESTLSRLQDTSLSPMEEVLFKSWTKANQIEDPDSPDDSVDYRGIYKTTGGLVLPYGELKQMTEAQNLESEMEKALHERMMERISEAVQGEKDFKQQLHDDERQDITHKQKMEQGKLKLKQAPFDLKKKQHDVEGKEIDLDKQKIGIDQQKLGNEGKRIDLMAALLAPSRPAGSPKNETK